MKLAGRLFEIYVHSYLQFGSNSINDWVAEILSTDRPGENQLVDPCILRGECKLSALANLSSFLAGALKKKDPFSVMNMLAPVEIFLTDK